MKSLLMAIGMVFCLISFAPTARAQSADEKYIAIYGAIQEAENQADTGSPQRALASLTDVQAQLQRFHDAYPTWQPEIVNYRLADLAKRITVVSAKVAALPAAPTQPAPAPALAPAAPAGPTPKEQALQAQLDAAQTENQTLQAKLREALSTQPANVDTNELAKNQEEIRALMKENDLLKANGIVNKNTNGAVALRQQLADAVEKYNAEQAQARKLVDENAALQGELKRAGKVAQDQASADLLRGENERLKSQLAKLQSSAQDAAAAGQMANQLDAANARVAALQSSATVATLEKAALENELKQASATPGPDQTRVAELESQVHSLTAQRDDLSRQLAEANQAKSKRHRHNDAGATNEVAVLRARLAVAEAKPSPYSAEELALLSQTPPAPANGQHSVHELPPGAAELVASARQHFANHEFAAAEADYQKILKQNPKNPLALGNLAAIELQENKLPEAEVHITAALAADPDDAYNLFTLGSLRYYQEKYDAALDALGRAAQLDGNNPEIQNLLGVTLGHTGQRMQAEAALRKAIEINPLYAQAHNNLAVVYLNQTPPMPLLARWHYQKAVAAGQPRNPDLEKLLADKGAPVDFK